MQNRLRFHSFKKSKFRQNAAYTILHWCIISNDTSWPRRNVNIKICYHHTRWPISSVISGVNRGQFYISNSTSILRISSASKLFVESSFCPLWMIWTLKEQIKWFRNASHHLNCISSVIFFNEMIMKYI